MLRTDLPSHRRTPEAQLAEALARREPLALAEACSRTLPVAFAVARRLLPTLEAEALLLAVYEQLWSQPPADVSLERWVRSRTSAIGLSELRQRGMAPAAPSVLSIAPDLPPPSLSYLDTTERTLQELDEDQRRVLLRAHDEGIPSAEQETQNAGQALRGALQALADTKDDEAADADGRLADWVLGLLAPEEAAGLEAEAAGDPALGASVQVLRRGRRRIEGLPPTPDLGPRLIAAVLTGLPDRAAPAAPGGPSSSDEADTGEIPVTAAHRPAREHDDTVPPPASQGSGTWGPSSLGSLDDEDPTSTGDVAASVDDDLHAEDSALGASPPAPGQATEELTDLSSSLREDPYADLREGGEEEAAPSDSGRDDLYAALRDHDDAGDGTAALDPEDPFGDLREDAGRRAEDDDAALGDDGTSDLDGYEEEGRRRSGLVRLLQAIGILALIAGGIGLGLLIGQLASTALRG